MKLFYHFLILVAASLVMFACASLFASNHHKTEDKPAERSSNMITDDSLVNETDAGNFIFTNLHYSSVLNGCKHNKCECKKHKDNNLQMAMNYLGQSKPRE